jgi:glycolate oxidase iron-sulfur subunit
MTIAKSWRTDFAPTNEELNSCVACGLCLPHCPTFRLTGLEIASPRGRIAAMRGVAEGSLALDSDFEDAMMFCLNCRACEAVCPSQVPFGRAMEGARAEIAATRPSVSRRIRHFLLGRVVPSRGLVGLVTDVARLAQTLRMGRMLRGRFGRALRGLRPLAPQPHQIENRDGLAVGLLVGCVMDKWFGQVNQAAIELLELAGFQVVLPTQQTCCGALAVHDGDVKSGRRLAKTNVAAFGDVDLVVATAAGCSAHLKSYDKLVVGGAAIAEKAKDITEVVAQLLTEGRLPRLPPRGEMVTLHEPCHLRHAQRITIAPKQVLLAAGYDPIEADPEGLCCGAAGIYSLLQPAASHQLGERIASLIEGIASSRLVASSNPGCEMQLRSHLERGFRVAHPVELYLEAIRSHDEHVLRR